MAVQKRGIMKTYSRFIFAPLILSALPLAMAVSAQERSASRLATTTKQQPSAVRETRATTKATPTPTPNPRIKLPSKIPTEASLPDVFRDRQRPQQYYPYPPMPNLIGVELRKAESAVRQIQPNARLSEQEGKYTNSYGPGVVVNQSPQAGAFLKPGVQVILYYNPKPPPPVYSRMPNLIGLDGKAAVSKLSSDAPGVQWKVQQADAYFPNYQAGAVVSQLPVAGTELRPGISAVIYLNPQLTVRRMPNVVGMNARSATQTLRQETPDIPYQYEIAPRNDPNYVEGIVVSQYPAAGTELRQGIKIVMSLNPRPAPPPPGARTLVVVPDVRKKELTEAIGLLGAAQLNVGAVTKKDPNETADSVLEQQPLPGQQVAVASRIDLVIGKEAETGGLIKEALKILGVIALGFFAFLTGRLWRRFGSKPGEARANSNALKIPPDHEPPPPAPTLTFRSIVNASSSEFAASTELQTSFALRFQPKADWGRQYITHTGGQIAAESEEL